MRILSVRKWGNHGNGIEKDSSILRKKNCENLLENVVKVMEICQIEIVDGPWLWSHAVTVIINLWVNMVLRLKLQPIEYPNRSLMAYSHWRFFQVRSELFSSRSNWYWYFL